MSESVGENLLGTFLKSQFLFLTSKWLNLTFPTKLDSRTLNICYTSVQSIMHDFHFGLLCHVSLIVSCFVAGRKTNDGLPASARLCSDWTAADSAPSRTDWLARSSTANGWAACAADTGVYENTWTDNTEKQQTSPVQYSTNNSLHVYMATIYHCTVIGNDCILPLYRYSVAAYWCSKGKYLSINRYSRIF